jgi:hypothetical protein
LKRAVPTRQRSKFIQDLLEQALPPAGVDETDPLYLAALSVEADESLAAEMAGWEPAMVADGVAAPSGGGTDR